MSDHYKKGARDKELTSGKHSFVQEKGDPDTLTSNLTRFTLPQWVESWHKVTIVRHTPIWSEIAGLPTH